MVFPMNTDLNAKVIEWREARKAFLSLETKDVRNSNETIAALQRLASAEDALFRIAASLSRTGGQK